MAVHEPDARDASSTPRAEAPRSICFINSFYAPDVRGGAEVTLQRLAEGLVARGWRVSVICLAADGAATEAVLAGVRVFHLAALNPVSPFRPAKGAARLVQQALEAYNPLARLRVQRLLRRIRPDLVSVHNFRGFSTSVWQAARHLGLPIVQTLHDYTLVCPRGVMFKHGRSCAKQCVSCRLLTTPRRLARDLPELYTTVSARTAERVKAAGGVPAGASPLVILGDAPPPQGASLPTEHTWLRVGYLGRLEPVKGVEILIAAARRVAPNTLRIRIAGRGEEGYEGALKDEASDLPDVTFEGRVAAEPFLARLDVLVVPSVWEEPMGRVLIEAFAAGVPVVASRIGGMPELVEEGVTGRLFTAGSDVELADILTDLAMNTGQLGAMADRCRDRASELSTEAMVARYEAAFLGVAKVGRGAGS